MRFAYAVIGFMKNLIVKTKKVLRNIGRLYNQLEQKIK